MNMLKGKELLKKRQEYNHLFIDYINDKLND